MKTLQRSINFICRCVLLLMIATVLSSCIDYEYNVIEIPVSNGGKLGFRVRARYTAAFAAGGYSYEPYLRYKKPGGDWVELDYPKQAPIYLKLLQMPEPPMIFEKYYMRYPKMNYENLAKYKDGKEYEIVDYRKLAEYDYSSFIPKKYCDILTQSVRRSFYSNEWDIFISPQEIDFETYTHIKKAISENIEKINQSFLIKNIWLWKRFSKRIESIHHPQVTSIQYVRYATEYEEFKFNDPKKPNELMQVVYEDVIWFFEKTNEMKDFETAKTYSIGWLTNNDGVLMRFSANEKTKFKTFANLVNYYSQFKDNKGKTLFDYFKPIRMEE